MIPGSRAGGTVLLADDDRVALTILRRLLRDQGCDLECVESGAEAVARTRELRPDLVLLDVNMPDVNGFDVCRMIRADRTVAEIPIMMVTALADREARLRGIEAGADDFITKPFDHVELRARVRTVLRLNRYRRVQEAHDLAQQMEMAAAIQQQLLPKACPQGRGFRMAARYQPAAFVGGDFYDFITRDGEIYFVIADAAGHGMASALFMANARSAIRSSLERQQDLTALVESLNARIVEDSGDSGMFMTAVIGRFTPASRRMMLVNCGHPDPLVRRATGAIEPIAAGAPPLGLLAPLDVEPAEIVLGDGDMTCLCTDGLIEAFGGDQQLFGLARLGDTLAREASHAPDVVIDRVLDALRAFRGPSGLEDDLTLVVIQGVSDAA